MGFVLVVLGTNVAGRAIEDLFNSLYRVSKEKTLVKKDRFVIPRQLSRSLIHSFLVLRLYCLPLDIFYIKFGLPASLKVKMMFKIIMSI